jgi:hypothetical protein
MDSLKPYVIGLLCGFAFGVVLMERWRRTGQLGVSAAGDLEEAVETETASTASADQPKVSAVIVAGAKADAQRARQLLERVMPWGSTSGPSIDQLQRAGQANTRRSN